MSKLNKILLPFGFHIRYKRLWITKRLEKIIWFLFIFLAIYNYFKSL